VSVFLFFFFSDVVGPPLAGALRTGDSTKVAGLAFFFSGETEIVSCCGCFCCWPILPAPTVGFLRVNSNLLSSRFRFVPFPLLHSANSFPEVPSTTEPSW